jgi:hypothetical protein
VLVPIGTIFDDLGGLSTLIGNGIQEFGVDTVPAINQLLFDIPTQLALFGSALFDLIPGVGAASDVSALPDVSALSDVSSLLNPADFATLFDQRASAQWWAPSQLTSRQCC